MWLLAVLMGDCINRFFYKKMFGRFAGLQKKLAIIERSVTSCYHGSKIFG